MQTQDKKPYCDFTSQEEIDLEYNMAITVPDTKRWMSILINKSRNPYHPYHRYEEQRSNMNVGRGMKC
jgi:hypothetical protein